MTNAYLLLTPLLMLPIVALLGFVGGCQTVWGVEGRNPSGDQDTTESELPGPTNLVAVAGDSVVDLSWDDYVDADEYHVKRGEKSGQYDTFPLPVQIPTYADTYAVNGKTYYYVVSAMVGGVETMDSEETPPVTPMATIADFVKDFTPVGMPTNIFNGWAGMEFTVASQSLDVHALGRVYADENEHQHAIKIIKKAGLTDVAAVTLVTMGGTNGQMQTAPLTNPVTLSPNTTYYIVSQETDGADKFFQGESTVVTTGVADVINAIAGDGVNFQQGISGYHCFGPLTFHYSVTP